MKTLREVLDLSQRYLQERGVPSTRREAEDLLSAVLQLPRLNLYLNADCPLEEKELIQYRQFIQRRGCREPLAYILKEMEFYHCHLHVEASVLIPRQETEILVDLIVKLLQREVLAGKHLWDICCGSGCIAVSVKKALPALHVSAADVSQEALALTKQNAQSNGVEIACVQGDFLEPFAGQKAHYVVCNPPYVSAAEWECLEPEVKEYEPKLALVADEGGFYFYRKLAEELPAYLHPGAKVFLEMGANQGKQLQQLFVSHPWTQGKVLQDWSGKDRFFFVEIE